MNLSSDFRHPASDNRMRFLFTMSDIGGRKTDDGEQTRPRRPSGLRQRRPERVITRAKAKLIKLHRKDGSSPRGANPEDVAHPPSVVRSPSSENGGARRDRTDDLMLAKHALSQLSYGPVGGRRSQDGRRMRPSVIRRLLSVVRRWWAWEDLNLRPHAYQARALTN